MADYRNDIEKYLKGELTPAEMHALEKKALSDPFLADALEGAEQISGVDFSKDIASLNERILKQKTTTWAWPMRIAAGIILVTVASFIVWIVVQPETEETLALENKTEQVPDSKEQTSPDTITQQPVSPETQPEKAEEQNKLEPAPSAKTLATTEKPTKPVARKKKKISPEPFKTNVEDKRADSVHITPSQNGFIAQQENTETQSSFAISDSLPKNKIKLPAPLPRAEGSIATVDARPTIVTGRVLSAEDGSPLPNVSVALKGTSVMTKTDAYGRYAIAADSRNRTLVYSSEGQESTEVKITSVDSTYLPVKLEDTEEMLKEAVVETSGMRDFGPMSVYTIPAHPEIGNRAFKQYLQKNVSYPKDATEKKVQGTVIIEFKVDYKGTLSEFRIVRGIGSGCDEELIRLILQGAKWVPTTKDSEPVSDKARVKFKFEIEE